MALPDRLIDFLNAHYPDAPFRVETAFETNGRRAAVRLHGATGRYVAKITDPDRAESTVYSDTRTMAYLSNNDYPAPRLLPTLDGALYLDASGIIGDPGNPGRQFVYLYEYIPGAMPHPGAAFFRRLGKTLARLHSLPWEGIVPNSPYRPVEELALVRPRVQAVSDPAQRAVRDDILGLIDRFPSFDTLPTGIIHTDPYYVNLLESPWGAIYLIDWDDAGVSYPLLDVGYVMAHLCSFTPRDRELLNIPGDPQGLLFRPDWAGTFLDAYQTIRPLTNAEHQCLADAIRLSFIIYITDWGTGELILGNYQRMKMVEKALGLPLG